MSSPKIFQIWTALVKRDDQNVYDQRPIVIWGFQGDKIVALKCTTNLNTNIAHLTLNKNHAGLKEDTVVELKRFYLIPKSKLLKYRGNLSFENKLDLIGRLDRNSPKEIIMQEKLILDEALFEDYNELTEAKKRKKKKISHTNPGEAIFKSVNDMKKWVKKRQKGLSPFCYLNPNAGNVPLGNSIFNSMFSSDGSSGVGTSEGGISNGGVSVGSGDAGGGMGESFNPDLKLKLHYTKSLSDYLTSTEQEFIRNNMDLIDSERWVELRDKVDNTFDYSESTTAIFKFLADGLGYDFTYFEELLKLE